MSPQVAVEYGLFLFPPIEGGGNREQQSPGVFHPVPGNSWEQPGNKGTEACGPRTFNDLGHALHRKAPRVHDRRTAELLSQGKYRVSGALND